MHTRSCLLLLALAGVAGLTGACSSPLAAPVPPTQVPADYLRGALDWIQAHAVRAGAVDWTAVRSQALALAPHPGTAAGTYAAINYALSKLDDPNAFLLPPGQLRAETEPGFHALYPSGLVDNVDPDMPAQQAGVRVGDIIEKINGRPLSPGARGVPPGFADRWPVDPGQSPTYTLTLRHPGQSTSVDVTVPTSQAAFQARPTGQRLTAGGSVIGYVDMPRDYGSEPYPTALQHVLRDVDSQGQAGVCGWIVDLRRNYGGDIWTMLAGIGPILGDGTLGGFVYANGTRDTWAYRGGKVYWNDQERSEDKVDGTVYTPRRAAPPVALLTSRETMAAGELVVIAFKGRPEVRTFGEATFGAAELVDHTTLSDNSELFVGGAYALDRNGTVYKGRIPPDQPEPVDLGRADLTGDPAVAAAQQWLRSRPGCAS
jgi:carboxyl-terminal processing protease